MREHECKALEPLEDEGRKWYNNILIKINVSVIKQTANKKPIKTIGHQATPRSAYGNSVYTTEVPWRTPESSAGKVRQFTLLEPNRDWPQLQKSEES